MPEDNIHYLVLDRRDPGADMAEFDVLSIGTSLFSDAALIRESGRIGTARQSKINMHDSEGAAVEALEIWLRHKQRRGYVTQPG